MSGSTAKGTAPRRPRLTGRAAVLALVLCSLVAALAYPTRQFIAQRSQIAQQRAAAAQAQAQVDELRREKARWQDPAYVAAQARERLHYGYPGETPFISVAPTTGAGSSTSGTPAAAQAQQPWYDSLFQSLETSDQSSAASAAAPSN